MWSFPKRGDWLSHRGDYRGNWSPHVPKNIILMYSEENDVVLDQFVGSGTTILEACRLGRKSIGIDINKDAIKMSIDRLKASSQKNNTYILKKHDARNLNFIGSESIGLICTHPPYANIIKYSKEIPGDISHLKYEEFLKELEQVARESYRVLKKRGICAFMMGDIRKKGYVVPLGMNSMQKFVNAGFKVKEIIIKEQHNCKTTEYWDNIKKTFLMLAHEYVFVLEKQEVS